jgi:PAS domain S-box-containing protein
VLISTHPARPPASFISQVWALPCLKRPSRRESPLSQSLDLSNCTADLYREIFAHSKEAIAIIDPDGYYLQQNGAHFTLLGYADDDLEGKTPAIYLGEKCFKEFSSNSSHRRLFRRDDLPHQERRRKNYRALRIHDAQRC